jgi:acetyl-CoA carboxylase / biotin carboxylase 1
VDGSSTLKSIDMKKGTKNGTPTHFVYPSKTSVQSKRYKAHVMGTTYVYDFPELFRRAVNKSWREYQKIQPSSCCLEVLVKEQEYFLDASNNFVPVVRADGKPFFVFCNLTAQVKIQSEWLSG